MSYQAPKSQVLLDWFNVTYRSVGIALGGALLLVVGGFAYWIHARGAGPRTEATEAIARAADRFKEASSLDSEERIDSLRDNARSALDEAHGQYDDGRFDDARRAAIRSENLSQKALDLAQGEGTEHDVRFCRLEGEVRIKRSGEFSWEEATRKMALRAGDQVKTSASASAEIIYFDGTVTTIQPGSLLEIRDLFEDPATKVRKVSEKLNWGEVLASSQKKNVTGSFHEVATDKAALRSTEPGQFRVAYDAQKGTGSFDVFQGRVEVASPSRKESVVEGERIETLADGRLSAKATLPAAPRLIAPSDQRVFVYDEPAKETTTLSWEGVPGADHYHLTISDRPLFTDPLYDQAQHRDTSVRIDGIAAADYYWKVSALTTSGVEGPPSSARRFRVTSQRIRDREDRAPPALEITEFVQTGAVVIINGKTEPGAVLWVDNEKVDVYEDGTFYAVVRLRKEGENSVAFVAQDAAGNTTQTTRKAYFETY